MSFHAATAPECLLSEGDIGLVIGGAAGERHIWWNFVAASPERIEQAKGDWQAGRFAAVPGDEFIPLPDS